MRRHKKGGAALVAALLLAQGRPAAGLTPVRPGSTPHCTLSEQCPDGTACPPDDGDGGWECKREQESNGREFRCRGGGSHSAPEVDVYCRPGSHGSWISPPDPHCTLKEQCPDGAECAAGLPADAAALKACSDGVHYGKDLWYRCERGGEQSGTALTRVFCPSSPECLGDYPFDIQRVCPGGVECSASLDESARAACGEEQYRKGLVHRCAALRHVGDGWGMSDLFCPAHPAKEDTTASSAPNAPSTTHGSRCARCALSREPTPDGLALFAGGCVALWARRRRSRPNCQRRPTSR